MVLNKYPKRFFIPLIILLVSVIVFCSLAYTGFGQSFIFRIVYNIAELTSKEKRIALDIPQYPGTDQWEIGWIQTFAMEYPEAYICFNSNDSFDQVYNFYKKAFKEKGWGVSDIVDLGYDDKKTFEFEPESIGSQHGIITDYAQNCYPRLEGFDYKISVSKEPRH